MRKKLHKYLRLEWVAALLLVVNFFVTYNFDLEFFRLVRLISLCTLVIYYLYKKHVKSIFLLLAFLFFISRDVGYQFFEEIWGAELYMASATIGYLLLFFDRIPYLKNGIKWSTVLLTFVLVVATGSILLLLGDLAEANLETQFELILFYSYGVSLILLVLAACYYNHRLNSMRSLLFIFTVFGFVVSDIAACLAYFNEMNNFYYLDRSLFIVSMALLANFGMNVEGAELEQADFLVLKE
ncbi:hypothetical protein [Leeuwenhoekiella marinoflava]|uniref:hypothetical protein n=1 Tax=Leeuwenhoekiella marinoflava TaxID=988 RepID=UPI000FFF202D|nr:hypothetical protein [Leeuwenhoekiella marinoflava]